MSKNDQCPTCHSSWVGPRIKKEHADNYRGKAFYSRQIEERERATGKLRTITCPDCHDVFRPEELEQ